MMMQFGDDNARGLLIGSASFFKAAGYSKSDTDISAIDFGSKVPTKAQRFYNQMCVALGSDLQNFQFLLAVDGFGKYRAQGCDKTGKTDGCACVWEYEAVRRSFSLRIMPFVDPDQAVKVRATQGKFISGGN